MGLTISSEHIPFAIAGNMNYCSRFLAYAWYSVEQQPVMLSGMQLCTVEGTLWRECNYSLDQQLERRYVCSFFLHDLLMGQWIYN